jgi:hypothetical protein
MEYEGGSFIDNIIHAIRGPRLNYRPQDREFLEKYGNCPITFMSIYRRPIPQYINLILSAISFGKFDELKNEQGMDKLFHLYLLVQFKLITGELRLCKIEKNEVITITPLIVPPDEKDANNFSVFYHRGSITINQLLNNSRKFMGEKRFFEYDAFTNNCQVFILSIFEANKLLALNPKAKFFIYQNVEKIKSGLDSYVSKFANFTTDLAHRIDIVKHGEGFVSP